MQKIAAENRHSETAFIVPRDGSDFDLRWFTPEIEDDLCGHATLASAYVLELRKHDAWPVRFHTRSGILTVVRYQGSFQMDFSAGIAAERSAIRSSVLSSPTLSLRSRSPYAAAFGASPRSGNATRLVTPPQL